MPVDPPPPPPKVEQGDKAPCADIADMREAFARKTPQTEQDRAAAKAFIQGKIKMLLCDPHMTKAQKAAAIAGLEALRDADETGDEKKLPR
jgi:hypothetical protein